jgi:hypothetical protein
MMFYIAQTLLPYRIISWKRRIRKHRFDVSLSWHWSIGNWTQTGKGIYIRTLCQKNEGSVETKQRSAKMGDRIITGHCHLKGHLFKLGLTDDPICERCLQEHDTATHILCDCEAIAYLRFRHLGQFFMEPSDFYDAPIIKVLHFIRSVRLIMG